MSSLYAYLVGRRMEYLAEGDVGVSEPEPEPEPELENRGKFGYILKVKDLKQFSINGEL